MVSEGIVHAPTATGRIGVDIDGTQLVAVEVDEHGQTVSVAFHEGDTAAAAVRAWRSAHHPRRPVRALYGGQGLLVRRARLVEAPAEASGSSGAVGLELPGGALPASASEVELAVALSRTDSHEVAVAAAPQGDVQAIYQELLGIDAEVVPAPFVYPIDGLYLAVMMHGVEMTVVADGLVTRHRTLRVAGASVLVDGLGVGDGARTRAEAALAGATDDPEAVAAAQRYLDGVSQEVGTTIEYWRRQDPDLPNEVGVHGTGASSPLLAARLAHFGVSTRVVAPPPSGNGVVTALNASRLTYAWLAATGTLPPRTVFVDRVRQELQAEESAGVKQRRVQLGLATVAALAAVLALWPTWTTMSRLDAARQSQGRAEAAVAPYRGVLGQVETRDRLRTDLNAKAGTRLGWGRVVDDLRTSLPAGAVLTQVHLGEEAEFIPVDMTLTYPAGDPRTLADWDAALRRAMKVTDFELKTVVAAGAAEWEQATVSFRIPVDRYRLTDGA